MTQVWWGRLTLSLCALLNSVILPEPEWYNYGCAILAAVMLVLCEIRWFIRGKK